MASTEEILAQLTCRRPFAARLTRLAPQTAAVAAAIDALVERLVGAGLLGRDEWQAKLNEVWQRDFAELAQALWEREGAAEEGDLCQKECGARCCHSACLILTPREAAILRQRGQELGLEVTILGDGGMTELSADESPEAIASSKALPGEWMLPAFPCPFLSFDRRCRVYPDRPLHCQGHPRYWREECPLSHRWYFSGTNIPRQPLEPAPADVLERLARLTRPR